MRNSDPGCHKQKSFVKADIAGPSTRGLGIERVMIWNWVWYRAIIIGCFKIFSFKSVFYPLIGFLDLSQTGGAMFRLKGVYFNLLFILYAVFIHERIIDNLDVVMREHSTWKSMAVLLFFLSLMEGIYLPKKIRNAAFRKEGDISPNQALVWFAAPLVFRVLIGLITAVTVFSFMSPGPGSGSPLEMISAVMALLLVVKEIAVFFRIFGVLSGGKPAPVRSWVVWSGDTIILIYSCIVYSMVTRPGFFFTVKSKGSLEMLPLIIVGLFGMLFSLRFGFWVEEFIAARTRRDRILIWSSLLFASITGAWVLVN